MSDRPSLKIVVPEPIAFGSAWHARMAQPPAISPAQCCFCNRYIAVEPRFSRMYVACIYCGLERGLIPEEEIEPS